MKIERLVLDISEAPGLCVFAWAKLFKSWASLRWSDIQAEGRLFTILRQTKISAPNRRIKELPVCVSEKAGYADAVVATAAIGIPRYCPERSILPTALAILGVTDSEMEDRGLRYTHQVLRRQRR